MAEGEQHLLKAHLLTAVLIIVSCPFDCSRLGDILSDTQEIVIYYEDDLKYWIEHKY